MFISLAVTWDLVFFILFGYTTMLTIYFSYFKNITRNIIRIDMTYSYSIKEGGTKIQLSLGLGRLLVLGFMYIPKSAHTQVLNWPCKTHTGFTSMNIVFPSMLSWKTACTSGPSKLKFVLSKGQL